MPIALFRATVLSICPFIGALVQRRARLNKPSMIDGEREPACVCELFGR
jgi:hypothetical protein